MVTINNEMANEVMRKTTEAIEVKYKKEIDLINSMIGTAANDCKFKIEVTNIPNMTEIGSKLKQYYVYNGFDVEFYAAQGVLKISWFIPSWNA